MHPQTLLLPLLLLSPLALAVPKEHSDAEHTTHIGQGGEGGRPSNSHPATLTHTPSGDHSAMHTATSTSHHGGGGGGGGAAQATGATHKKNGNEKIFGLGHKKTSLLGTGGQAVPTTTTKKKHGNFLTRLHRSKKTKAPKATTKKKHGIFGRDEDEGDDDDDEWEYV